MHRNSLQFLLSFILPIIFLGLATFSQGQNSSVNGKRVFTCQNDEAGVTVDSFPTPDGAVNHYITKHMPSGFKLKAGTIEVLENGWVVFTTHKNGQQEASQGGHVLGRLICPPDSWVSSDNGGSFYDKKCNCNQGLVAYGDQCMRPEDVPKEEPAEEPKDECAQKNDALSAAQQKLKEQATQQLKKIVDQQNQLLANDLTLAQKVLSPAELKMYGLKFFAGYGHALERLTALAVEKDPLLSKTLEYIPNKDQRAAGGGPDFKGKGKLPSSVEFDVTTQKEMDKKLKSKDEKKCYQFVVYDRLNDRQGNLLE
jgi:hypothetical protein